MVIMHKLTLDVASDGIQGNLVLVRGERGKRDIAVTLRCGKVPIVLEAGQTAAIVGVKPDGGELLNSCVVYTKNGIYPNTILYHVTEGTVAAAGTFSVRLVVWDTDGNTLYSPEFSLTVKDNDALDLNVGARSEFTALIDAAAQAQRAAALAEETAKGLEDKADGVNTLEEGRGAHAEGIDTRASGEASHAEGNSSQASGIGGHAEGQNSKAAGSFSHAEGKYSEANGNYSHAEGNTKANGEYQHTQGKYNIEDKENKFAHIVGNGTNTKKSNAHTVDWKGNGWFAGKLSQEGVPEEEGDLVTLGYFNAAIAELRALIEGGAS